MLTFGEFIQKLRPRLCAAVHCNAIKGAGVVLPPESDSDNALIVKKMRSRCSCRVAAQTRSEKVLMLKQQTKSS